MVASFSVPDQTDPGSHRASCTIGTGSFPRVKRPGRGAACPSRPSAGLHMFWSFPCAYVDMSLWTLLHIQSQHLFWFLRQISLNYTTPQHNTTHHNTTQYNTPHHNTTQHNTIQHTTPHHTTTHHTTPQHNTTQHKLLDCCSKSGVAGFFWVVNVTPIKEEIR